MKNAQEIPALIVVMECAYRWNGTEVYRRDADRWQIIQTHSSYTQKV